MTILLKDSILQLLKSLSPKLYSYRFEEDLVKQVASNYIQGNKSTKLTAMFDGGRIEDENESFDANQSDESEIEQEDHFDGKLKIELILRDYFTQEIEKFMKKLNEKE